MNVRFLAILSFTLNLALAGWWLRPLSAPSRPTSDAVSNLETAPTESTSVLVASPIPLAPEPPVAAPAAGMCWSRLEPGDLRALRDNLRVIGCPDKTLRDILRSMVDQVYTARALEAARPYRGRFWELGATYLSGGSKVVETHVRALTDSLEALDKERHETLSSLLRETTHMDAAVEAAPRDEWVLGYLSPEKRERFRATDAEWNRRARQLQSEDAWNDAAAKVWRAGREAALQALLSPEEWLEYRLRTANPGRWTALRGIDLTEEEIRSLAVIQLQAESGQGAPRTAAPDAKQQVREAQQVLLGAERLAQLDRAQSGEYQQLLRIGDRLGWGEDTVVAAWGIERQARRQAEELARQQALDEGQRHELRALLRAETEASLRQVVPPGAFGNFERLSGRWWNDLGK